MTDGMSEKKQKIPSALTLMNGMKTYNKETEKNIHSNKQAALNASQVTMDPYKSAFSFIIKHL